MKFEDTRPDQRVFVVRHCEDQDGLKWTLGMKRALGNVGIIAAKHFYRDDVLVELQSGRVFWFPAEALEQHPPICNFCGSQKLEYHKDSSLWCPGCYRLTNTKLQGD